jgi:hypothetical protein
VVTRQALFSLSFRRAAHFANYRPDHDEAQPEQTDNMHVGGNEVTTLPCTRVQLPVAEGDGGDLAGKDEQNISSLKIQTRSQPRSDDQRIF